MKSDLIEEVGIELLRKGFTVKYLKGNCFDVLARRNSRILLLKVLQDANSVEEKHADEMKRISSMINASPIIIAEKAGSMLGENVVYSRFGIYTLSFGTFRNCMVEKMPFVKSSKAGLTAMIIGNKLRERREETGYSLAELSGKLGVSRSMITRYESEKAEISLRKAMLIYNVFGDKIFAKIDVFSPAQEMAHEIHGDMSEIALSTSGIARSKEQFLSMLKNSATRSMLQRGVLDISIKYGELGFQTTETKKVPFDVIAKMENEIILTGIGDEANPQLKSLTQLLDADNLVIFSKKRPREMPALTKKEFLEFESAHELIKFLREF